MSSATQVQPVRTSDRVARWVILLSVLGTIALFFVPAFVIRPFRYQSPGALSVALAFKQAAPSTAPALLAGAILLALLIWKSSSRRVRILLSLGLCLAAVAAVMSRVNYFEWMFHPVPQAGFETLAQTKLAGSEMIMAVRFGNEARAYPIRAMAYHHVLNDVVAGVPIAVTY